MLSSDDGRFSSEPQDDDPPQFDEPIGPAAPPTPRPAFRRVLVVDDHIDAAAALELFLVMHGYEALSARDGLEGLSAAESFRPEVILLDIGLPKLDGYETARRIRQAMWGRHVLLVAVSGLESKADRRRALEAGFDHFVTKPVIDVEAFLTQLNQWAHAH